MDRILASADLAGLAEMIAGIIRSNLEAHPGRGRLIDGARGTVTIRARDAGATVGLAFDGRSVRIGNAPHPRPQVEIVADADDLLSLSTVPLRFGLPDAATREGRMVAGHILRRRILVRGLLKHPGLVRRVQGLLSVS